MTRLLGIDPGTQATGYGVIDLRDGRLIHVAHGVIRTRPKEPLWVRLRVIHDSLSAVIDETRPSVMSMERCFVGKNIQSALKLGHARGAIMVLGATASLEMAEYSPSEIKNAVTGHGRADKHQVQEMVRVILGLPKAAPSDASDALAAAITHAHRPKLRPAMEPRP
jgi:crossover junction endodeoxyribonuclease RuvC